MNEKLEIEVERNITFEELISFKYAFERNPIAAYILVTLNVAIIVTMLVAAFI